MHASPDPRLKVRLASLDRDFLVGLFENDQTPTNVDPLSTCRDKVKAVLPAACVEEDSI